MLEIYGTLGPACGKEEILKQMGMTDEQSGTVPEV